MSNNYVYLKNLQGEVIKPITDLSAINLTPGNGIGVEGDTIGITDGYVASATFETLTDPATAANPDSSYIEGGTMFTLIGGYTVTDEIPPISGASHEKVPSEYSVRSAIDALATLGPSLAPGAGIVVETVPGGTGGTIAVAQGNGISVNTAQQGGVSIKAATSGGLSVTSDGVAVSAGNGITVGASGVEVKAKADGGITVDADGVSLTYLVSGATNGVKVVSGIMQADTGDGLVIESGAVAIDDASVKDVLTGATVGTISGTTNTGFLGILDEVVTPGNLRGALSVGQAVDVSCAPYNNSGSIVYVNDDFLQGFTATMVSGTTVGFYDTTTHRFPKFADNLVYLFIANVSGSGTVTPNGASAVTLSGTSQRIWTKVTASDSGYISASANATMTVTNWRQYEVTALTDEAIAYLAQLPDPDAFFRSTSAYSIRDMYLIKQDMVCPFIPIIGMTNSDLTIAAGLAYQLQLTGSTTYHFSADTIPTNGYGWDSHLQLFVSGNSTVVFDPPLALMDPLTPNAGHNITVKWRAGQALAYVDDTDVGYVVSITSGSSNGTLAYGLANDTGEYIVFSTAIDGQTCSAGDTSITINRNLNVLGNGTDNTIITGNISATSGNTINFQSLTIDGGTFGGAGSSVVSNVMISGPVEAASGSTVSFSGTNVLNSTISGAGQLVFAAGSTTSSSENTGVLDLTNSPSLIIGSGNNTVLDGLTITGITNSIVGTITSFPAGTTTVRNCEIVGCTATSGNLFACYSAGTYTFEGCTFTDTRGYLIRCNNDNVVCYITGCTGYASGPVLDKGIMHITDCRFTEVTNSASPVYFHGTNRFGGVWGNNGEKVLTDNSTFIFLSSDSWTAINGVITVGDNVTLQNQSNTSCTVDALTCSKIYWYFKFEGTNGITITGSKVDPWKATNVIFASPIDAAQANTIKLSGTTFTSASQVLNANRIQLPTSTTVSFQGNTNSADTKILDASLIVVGDNPASPSGSVTVQYVTGTTTLSGIGTYVQTNGANDFVANNATNVVPVDASTTGAKYLGTVLSATTGETGANRFAKIDSGAVAVVNEATNAVNKQIITHDYEPILGGTFSLTSATVNEATKTVAIQSGGTMSVVDIRGGEDSVIDLGGTRLFPAANTSARMSGVVITGGRSETGAAFNLMSSGVALNLTFCTISGNTNSDRGTIYIGGGNTATMTNCLVESNTAPNFGNFATVIYGGLELTGCTAGTGQDIQLGSSATLTLMGTNVIDSVYKHYTDTNSTGKVIISSGAILDLTGNANATPIAPGGGIVFESGGATVLYGEVGSVGSLFIDKLSAPAGVISSGGMLNVRATGADFYPQIGFHNYTVSGGTLMCGSTGSNGTIMNYFNDGDITLKDMSLTAMITINSGSGTSVQGGAITFSGTIKFIGSIARVASTIINGEVGTCNLLDGTVIDVTNSTRGSTTGIFGGVDGANHYTIGTIVIGNNVTLKNGTTITPLAAGTYHRCVILKNGTITEYPAA